MAKGFLPYGRQVIDDDDIEAVVAALKSDFLTTGPIVSQFEKALVLRVKASEAVVCSSGTSALHLALLAIGVGVGDKVIVPAMTFVATANMVRACGGDVIFADVNPVTGLMECMHLTDALQRAGEGVKAVMPVLMNGNAGNLSAIMDLCEEWGIPVVVDAAHAIGSEFYDNTDLKVVGCDRAGVMTCFSFHPVKTIAMGEGGAITTSDTALADRMRSLRHHGLVRDSDHFKGSRAQDHDAPWYHEFHELGYNYRASDIHCALGLSQLKKLDQFVEKRNSLVTSYADLLSGRDDVTLVCNHSSGKPAWHLMAIHLMDNRSKKSLMEKMTGYGVGTQIHYIPICDQPYYVELYGEQEMPGARAYYESVLSLPLHANMTNDDVKDVVSLIPC